MPCRNHVFCLSRVCFVFRWRLGPARAKGWLAKFPAQYCFSFLSNRMPSPVVLGRRFTQFLFNLGVRFVWQRPMISHFLTQFCGVHLLRFFAMISALRWLVFSLFRGGFARSAAAEGCPFLLRNRFASSVVVGQRFLQFWFNLGMHLV